MSSPVSAAGLKEFYCNMLTIAGFLEFYALFGILNRTHCFGNWMSSHPQARRSLQLNWVWLKQLLQSRSNLIQLA